MGYVFVVIKLTRLPDYTFSVSGDLNQKANAALKEKGIKQIDLPMYTNLRDLFEVIN